MKDSSHETVHTKIERPHLDQNPAGEITGKIFTTHISTESITSSTAPGEPPPGWFEYL
jgi:hypothetical protein